MPLTRLCNMFEEVAHTTPEVLIDDPGWIFAQRCEARWAVGGTETNPVGLLIVYRSPMVRDTSQMYAPIAEILLGAARVDVLTHGFLEDAQMMRGRGEYLVARYTHEETFDEGPFSLEEIRAMFDSAIGSALGATGVAA